MTCQTCKFYVPFGAGKREDGECRRYPPQVVVVGQRNEYAVLYDAEQTIYPNVWQGNWCGEYKA